MRIVPLVSWRRAVSITPILTYINIHLWTVDPVVAGSSPVDVAFFSLVHVSVVEAFSFGVRRGIGVGRSNFKIGPKSGVGHHAGARPILKFERPTPFL